MDPPIGALAARLAQARTERQREIERRTQEMLKGPFPIGAEHIDPASDEAALDHRFALVQWPDDEDEEEHTDPDVASCAHTNADKPVPAFSVVKGAVAASAAAKTTAAPAKIRNSGIEPRKPQRREERSDTGNSGDSAVAPAKPAVVPEPPLPRAADEPQAAAEIDVDESPPDANLANKVWQPVDQAVSRTIAADCPLSAAESASVPDAAPFEARTEEKVGVSRLRGLTLTPEMLVLVQELERTRAEAEGLRAQMQEAQEELRAMRRRGERERDDLNRFAAGDVIMRIIPVVDDLDRALAHVPPALSADPWVKGVLMIGQGMQAMLAQQGVDRIMPRGEPFDPHRHEAVTQLTNADIPEDTITDVYRPGYSLYGRILRPAQVQVSVRKDP